MVNPRELAVKILNKLEQGSYSNLLLNKYLTSDFDLRERAFVTELVYGVVKNKLRLDYTISQFSKIKPSKMSLAVLNILRLGVYQTVFLDRVPDFAVVNESVELVKRMDNKKAAGFVNAVLRAIIRKKQDIIYPDAQKDPVKYLSIYYSFPTWMIERWLKLFGYDFCESLCQAFNERAKVCIRINTLTTTKEELEAIFNEENVKTSPGLYLNEALYIESSPPLTSLSSFNRGLFQPQDESSMIASKILAAKSGENILDVAAAPGGKTAFFAQSMGNKGHITAWDIHPHRVKLIEETCHRLGISIVNAEVKDARIVDEESIARYDKVLIDAPCTGLGIIRRKPDIKWSKKPEDLTALKLEQQNILSVCAKYVKPGGILVYSTCSIEPEENQGIVDQFLRENTDFSYDDIRPYLPEKLILDKPSGFIQLYPNVHGTDGFFVARLKRQNKEMA